MSDSAFTCHFLDGEAFARAEADRMALAKKRGADPEWLKANNTTYGWAGLHEVVKPCAMWFASWWHDPKKPEDLARVDQWLAASKAEPRKYYLSRFYLESWAHIRPPICVLTPNGREWCVDAHSKNGDGWQVTGDAPTITCAPSILVPGYHGFLRGGVFTPNM